ncbi:MAG: RNA polymerase sigma factor [Planctomycetes bacterium]|nr:RNA polymerase sigma factor [Planctomycetota bacterium]
MEDYILDLKAGKEQGWEIFYENYFALLRGFCGHYVQNRNDAEDLAQEVIIRVRQKIHTYDENRPFKPWVYQVARNICLNTIRDKKRSQQAHKWAWSKSFYATTTKIHVLDSRPSPQSEICKQEQDDCLGECMDSLSEDHRTVLLLKYAENLSRKDMAEVLDIPIATVKSRLFHALKHMRKNFDSSTKSFSKNI